MCYIISKCCLVGDHLLGRDSGPYEIFMTCVCVCCYNRYNANAVKGLWALWDNIYDYMCLL
jgi:hypothetical protein